MAKKEAPGNQNPDALKLRELGKTGLVVPRIGVGTTALGNMPGTYGFPVRESDAHIILQDILSGPFKFIDTASVYGDSERRIGDVARRLGGFPSDIIISTKIDRNPETNTLDAQQAEKSLLASFERLGVDYLPLVFIHDPEHATNTSFEEIVGSDGALSVLKEYQRGKNGKKIGHIGISGGPIDLLVRYLQTGEFAAVITHNRHTLLNQTAEPLFQAASEMGVAVINAAPFASGILARSDGRFAYQEPDEDIRSRVASIRAICDRYHVPLAAVALQFSLRDPRTASTIVGVAERKHLAGLESLTTYPIPDDVWELIKPFAVTDRDPEATRVMPENP